MGMIGNFAAVSADQLARLRNNPDLIPDYLYDEHRADPAREVLDVDKAWQGIHYLLTGSDYGGDPPWSQVVFGGETIGPDVGMGPARFLTPPQVREIAAALGGLSRAELSARYNPAEMDEFAIYPGIWERDGAEGLEYLLAWYDALEAYYRGAAERGDGMLLWVS